MENTVIQKKICMLGDFAVGKTSLVRHFVYSIFDEKYLSTIGVVISQKRVQVTDSRFVQMIVWDLSGSEEFNGHRETYLKGAAGAFFVCDLTREKTFPLLARYRERLGNVSPNAAFIVLGNKSDLVADALQDSEQRVARLAEDLKCPYFITSAKTGLNVEQGFYALAQKMIAG